MRKSVPALVVIAAIVALCVVTLPALAIDVGDPVYQQDVSGKGRVEVLYEKYDRDATFDIGSVTFTGPGGSVTVSVDEETESTDSDIFLLRGTLLSSETVSVYGDVGILDDADAEDTAFVIGAGVRVLAYQNEAVRLSVFGAGHYVPSYDASSDDFDPDMGRIQFEGEIDYFELSGGALLSGDLALDEKTKIIPYGGLAISILRGNVDATINYPDIGLVGSADTDVKEDDLVQLILGGSLLFNENWSIRVEARLIGDSSVSGSLGVAF